MKNKEFYKLLNKNRSKSNSGFTLTELLVGVIMSTFVIGALGFGLMSMLRVTTKGDSETAARNETSRALDFISDEMRRAESIDVDMDVSKFNTVDDPATLDVDESVGMVAKDYDLPTGGNIRLSLKIPGVLQRVIYSVAPPKSNSPWKGPLVIYRWGPTLDGNGNYVTDSTKAGRVDNPAGWTHEALVDGVSDTSQTQSCDGTNISYQGFFACVVDDDGDSTASEPEDSDGKAIAAQLYFTGQTKGADGVSTSTYSADTKTVARARTAPGSVSRGVTSYTMSYKTLGAVYGCEPGAGSTWTMRTDFINNLDDPDNETGNSNKKWVHKANRQPQPIKIDTTKNLEISSVPIGTSDCISRGGDKAVNGQTYTNKDLTEESSIYEKDGSGNYVEVGGKPKLKTDVHRVKHTVDFNDPATYNGYDTDNVEVGNGTVLFLRKDSILDANFGYDPDNDATNNSITSNDQQSLGEFLVSEGYAVETSAGDRTATPPVAAEYKIINITDSERIVAFEVGQESTATDQPGFDLQDNIFILTSDVFKTKTEGP